MKRYQELFDASELEDSKKKYFESMLQAISEVQSVQKVFDSLLERNLGKIKISFSIPKDSIEKGLAHTGCRTPSIELKENENPIIGSIDFFSQAEHLAHEITHFDNDQRLSKIKNKLNIKQSIVSFLFDEVQASSIEKDCQNYFRKKNQTYNSSFRFYNDRGEEAAYQHRLQNPQQTFLDFIQGKNYHRYTGYYIDIPLKSMAQYPTYGKGMADEEFYSYLRTNLFKTDFIPKHLDFNWCKVNSDRTYWIQGKETTMLFDEQNNPIYAHFEKENTIFSKKIRNINGRLRPEFWDNESNSHVYSLEEAKAYQSVCGTCFGIGNILTPLYCLAVSTTGYTKRLCKKAQSNLTQILKRASTRSSAKKNNPILPIDNHRKIY